jgi:hypothetical protein
VAKVRNSPINEPVLKKKEKNQNIFLPWKTLMRASIIRQQQKSSHHEQKEKAVALAEVVH